VANVQDLNDLVANAIENLVWVSGQELHPDVRMIRFVSGVWMLTKECTDSRMLAKALRAPLGERDSRYWKILSRSENASGV
jgi:hypothetical protein